MTRPITIDEQSWIGAWVCVGGILGNIFFGLVIDRIGRKWSILLATLPNTGLWITSILATEIHHFYIARFLGGLTGGGIFVCFPIFVAEISSNNIRGRLGSMFILSLNTGIMVGYALSSVFDYKTVGFIAVGLPVASAILSFFILSETPQQFIRNKNEEEAKKSLRFYRNCRGVTCSKDVDAEFEAIKKGIIEAQGKNEKITLSDFTEKRAMKALFVGFGLMTLNQFSGGYTFINYAASIFELSYSDIDANLSTVIMGGVQIVGTLSSLVLVDILGRKMLLIISASGMCAGMFCGGLYQYLYHIYDLTNVTWIPTVAISGVILFGSIGIFSATFVVFVELLPSKIRSAGSMMCLVVLSSLGFIMLRYFPVVLALIGLQGVLFWCSGFCLAGMFFILIFVKETKGKSLDKASSDDA
ncbi:hypothetical protein ACFFRR_008748 [Megaselia abdita]